jgi:prepilin-type N-terminal cleavage/methylation domain-containing protein
LHAHTQSRPGSVAEAGFTLIEVIVVAALLSVVVAALTAPLAFSIRQTNTGIDYAYSQQQARTAIESMVAQVRQATAILTPDSNTNSIDMNVTLNGAALQVYYECDIAQPGTSYHECVRVQAPIGSSLPSLSTGTVVASNLTNGTSTDQVFSLGPSGPAPYYMTATLKVPASGGTNDPLTHQVVLSDGALMRNMNIGN